MTTQQPLGEIAEIVRGITFPKEAKSLEPRGGDVACLRTTNVQRVVEWDDLWFVPSEHVKRAEQFVQPGDILISTANSYELVGKVALLSAIPMQATLGAFISLIRARPGVDPRFLYHQLAWGRTQSRIRETASTTTNISNVSTKKLAALELDMPPLDVQRRIVVELEKQFSRLDEAAVNVKRVKANLRHYKAAVLRAAVEGLLVPTEAERARLEGHVHAKVVQLPAEVSPVNVKKRAGRLWGSGHVPALTDEERKALPAGWVWVKVRDLGLSPEDAVQVGPMSMKSSDFTTRGVPVLNVGCVQWGGFDESKLNYLPPELAAQFTRYMIEPGDVLFTRSGTVGRCAVAQQHQKHWLMTFHLLRARPNPAVCLPEYLRAVFEGATHIRRQTREASVGSTRAGFNTNLLAMLDVPLPPLAEQHRIVGELDRHLSNLAATHSQVTATLARGEVLRQAVLSKEFTGSLKAASK